MKKVLFLLHWVCVSALLLCPTLVLAEDQTGVEVNAAGQPSEGDTTQLSRSVPTKQYEYDSTLSDLYIGFFPQVFGSASGSASANIEGGCLVLSCSTPSSSFQEGGTVTNLAIVGLRMGWWWDYLGITAELNQEQVRIEQITTDRTTPTLSPTYFEYDTVNLYLIPMARMPLFKSSVLPRGRLGLYGGVGVVVFGYSEDFTVASPQLANDSHSVSFGTAAASTRGNLMAVMGIDLKLSGMMFFVERRLTENSLSASGMLGVNASADVRSIVTTAGVSFRYR